MYYISAARYPGKKVSRPGVRFGLLLPESLSFVCLGSSQTLYWATPPQRWWKNASLWGVKVGDQGVVKWAVCHRGRLSLWGWIAVGAWVIFGVDHDTCVFSEIGFWSSLCIWSWRQTSKPHQTIMSMNRHNNTSPTCSTSNPTTQTNEINHEPSQTNQNDNQWPRFLIMEAADKNIPLNLNVFTLKKAVDGMANGPPVKCKPTKSGSIFIEVAKKHQSKNLLKTTMLMGCIPVKVSPHRILNSRKICHQMSRTGQHGRRRYKRRTQTTKNYCCQENLGALQPICDDNQRARHSGKNQYWIPEKRNKTLHSKPPKMLPMPKSWTHQKFM